MISDFTRIKNQLHISIPSDYIVIWSKKSRFFGKIGKRGGKNQISIREKMVDFLRIDHEFEFT